jgi:hypothetical protein
MKRIFMATVVVLSMCVLSLVGAANALAGAKTPGTHQVASISGVACPKDYYAITWQSYYQSTYFLSNDGWKTSNGVPILTYKWLGQLNQCLIDIQLTDGNWIEELANDTSQCMEDPGWAYNAGINQWSCGYDGQLNLQWAEINRTLLCGQLGQYGWALENQGVNQFAYFNVQNGQALLRDYNQDTFRECWT